MKKRNKITFHILTIFPKAFDSYFGESLFVKAKDKGIVKIRIYDIREASLDSHHKVDDRPFGGGPGMVLQVEPIYRMVNRILKNINRRKTASKVRVILFSPRGNKLDETKAKDLSGYTDIIMICGRYEGVDERVSSYIADEEISIGDYVLSGGELGAMVLTETVSRFIPGFLGKFESLEAIKGSYPSYTRPEIFYPKNNTQWKVPKVLLSGDHKKIVNWRKENSLDNKP